MTAVAQNSAIHETLITAYMSVCHEEKLTKEKQTTLKRLEARRAIERYFERKKLASDLEEYWTESI